MLQIFPGNMTFIITEASNYCVLVWNVQINLLLFTDNSEPLTNAVNAHLLWYTNNIICYVIMQNIPSIVIGS